MAWLCYMQRLDKASNSGGATFGKLMNIKVILKIPGGPNAMLVLDPETSGGPWPPWPPLQSRR